MQLSVLGLALAQVQGLRPTVGLIALGSAGRLSVVHLDAKIYRQAEQVLDEVRRLNAENVLPPHLTFNELWLGG